MHHINTNYIDGPSQDAILSAHCDIYIKQMDLIWGMMKHVSYVGGGNLVAWYLLFEKRPNLSILFLILTSFIMFTLLLIIRRQTYLQAQYGDKIRPFTRLNTRPRSGKLNKKTFRKSIYKRTLTAAYLARLIPTILILGNFPLITISSIKSIQNNSLFGFFILATAFALFVLFIANLKLLTDTLLYE